MHAEPPTARVLNGAITPAARDRERSATETCSVNQGGLIARPYVATQNLVRYSSHR